MSIIKTASTIAFSRGKTPRSADDLRFGSPADFYAFLDNQFAWRLNRARQALNLQWVTTDDVIEQLRNAQKSTHAPSPTRKAPVQYDILLEKTEFFAYQAAYLIKNRDYLNLLLPSAREPILRAAGFVSTDELHPLVIAQDINTHVRTSLMMAGHLAGLMNAKGALSLQAKYPFLLKDVQALVGELGFKLDAQALCVPVIRAVPRQSKNVLRLVPKDV